MLPQVLLVDYGDVISASQRPAAIDAMAAALDLPRDDFLAGYWKHRRRYDLGESPREYWSAVAGREVSDESLLARLEAHDVEGWSELNPGTVALLSWARERGVTVAVLSNAPHALAAAVRAMPALTAVCDHFSFSAEIGAAKPDPRAYRSALTALAASPGDVLFVDDRPENVDGARAVGLRAVRFQSADRLRAALS